MTCSGIALALLSAVLLGASTPLRAAEPALSIPGGSLRVTQRRAATILAIDHHGHTTHIVFPEDEGVFAGSLGRTQILGAFPGHMLILSSVYASRPRGGGHQCGAGTETILRVIVVLLPVPRQIFHQRVASCWLTIEAGEISLDYATRQLTIERTTFDPSGAHDLRTRYRISPDGVVRQVREPP